MKLKKKVRNIYSHWYNCKISNRPSIDFFDLDPVRFVSTLIVRSDRSSSRTVKIVEDDRSSFRLGRTFGTISIKKKGKLRRSQHDYNLRHTKSVCSRYPRLMISGRNWTSFAFFCDPRKITWIIHFYEHSVFSSLTSILESFEYTILAVRFNNLPCNYRRIR